MLHTTDIEKENLESHVEMCALRYADLDRRLSELAVKLSKIGDELTESKSSLAKVIITSTGLIISSVIGIVVTILIKF